MHAQSAAAPAKCPIEHAPSSSSRSLDSSQPAKCPIDHNGSTEALSLNPSNQMPHLPQSAAPGQRAFLPTDRSASTIPRANEEGGGVWEYPSPQQFHNALLRKGMETQEEDVEMMVQIHNFLNERAWDEVLRWEKKRDECVDCFFL